MIDETEVKINATCLKAGLTKMSIGKHPAWVSKTRLEGIEYRNREKEKIVTFWVKDLQRVYGEPASQSVQKVYDELMKEQGESTSLPPSTIDDTKGTITTLVPETLTDMLLEKWKKMSTFARMLMFQNTAPEHIKKKPKGNITVSYVEGKLMQTEANIAFLFAWSDHIDGFHFSENAVACYGSVKADIDGKVVIHSAVGVDLQEFKKSDKSPVFTQEELMKNAHMDMIKKALSKFGFNGDVYRGEV